MIRIPLIRATTVLAISVMLLITTTPKASGQSTRIEEAKLQEVKIVSLNIRRVARILKAADIPIEAGLLFTPHGREKLRPQLLPFPDMHVTKTLSEPLRGVIMADTLTFSEVSRLAADSVIIANQVTFTGRAPIIKGTHDFHLFVLNAVNVEHGRDTVITIDTSGTRGLDGIDGPSGLNGENGADGRAGEAGSCQKNKNGADGTAGMNGQAGAKGGTGTDGTNGNDAGHLTVVIPSINAGSFNLIANGGDGGNAGNGGPAGSGGKGGNGGRGGDGAGCYCGRGGIGEGGSGGAAGAGGKGGMGGQGGKGGNGGKAGTIVMSVPPNYMQANPMMSGGRGGMGGRGGAGGPAANAGMGGSYGLGGSGGVTNGCDRGRGGSGGAGASGGAGGDGGQPGEPGRSGDSGALSYTIFDVKRGVSGFRLDYEPGITTENCTQWFSGRNYIGCF